MDYIIPKSKIEKKPWPRYLGTAINGKHFPSARKTRWDSICMCVRFISLSLSVFFFKLLFLFFLPRLLFFHPLGVPRLFP